MTTDQTFVIVGASLAGAKAAETLRAEGFDGRLVLIGAEHERPYERPPLSKDYLRGEAGREKVYVHDEGFYAEHDIELRLGRDGREPGPVERASSRSTTASGCATTGCCSTTGAEPRRLAIPGGELDGVLYLRSVEDSDALRERLDRGGTVVVVGAGWIGAEVAASARQRGLEVTVLDPAAVPLERVLGAEVGAVYRDIHADHGVADADGHRRRGVRGRRPRSSASAPATGARSTATSSSSASACSRATELARRGRTRRRQRHPRRRAPADQRARRVRRRRRRQRPPPLLRRADPRRALGQRAQPRPGGRAQHARSTPAAYDRLPYFFSDQYDVGMEYSGFARSLGPGRLPRRSRRAASSSPSGSPATSSWRA